MRRLSFCSSLIMRLFLLCGLGIVVLSNAFVQPGTARSDRIMQSFGKRANADFGALCLSKKDDQNQVKVNIIPDIDAFSLTAVGFGLIAFNFFVLANMGDAGLAGIVARIINTFS